MKKIAYSEVRQNLKKIMDEVTEKKIPVVITRRDHKENAVLLSESNFKDLMSKKKSTGEAGQDG